MMAGNLSKDRLLLVAAMGISLATAGCFWSHPKIKVQKEKVAKNKPAPAPPAKPQPAPAEAAKTPDAKTPDAKAEEAKAPAAKPVSADDIEASAEPDKVLYDRALLDMKKGRYTESRLSLQTLINTYPDSEYLAKAKLMVADSFYKEGGTSNFTQAIDEYKNFIVFFPFLDEAAYSQMQVGMAHYRMMEKADRDSTSAQAAEDAFQTFLLKYPASPLVPQAEQRLREVQEVLADGEYKVARFYYVKQDFPASAARLVEMVDRYPLYSQSDEALWMLGNVYDRAKQLSKNEDMKNHFSDLAAKCYGRIVEDYPLSPHVGDSKTRLTAMGMAVPAVDANALARMQQQQMYEKAHKQNVALKFPMEMLHSGPPVTQAAHSGTPNLNPPTDAVSATEVLKASNAGPTFSMGAPPAADTNAISPDSAPVEAVTGGKIDPNAPTTGTTVQIIDEPAQAAPPANTDPQPQSAPPIESSTTGNSSKNDVPLLAPSSTSPDPAPETEKPATPAVEPASIPAPAPTTPPVTSAPPAIAPGDSQPAAAPSQSGTQAPATTPAPAAKADKTESSSASTTGTTGKDDQKKESTSKKKKGLKKLVPW